LPTARLGQSQEYVSASVAETKSSSAGSRKRETLSTCPVVGCRNINYPELSALKIARKLLIYDFFIGGEEEPSFARKTLDQSPISDF
jgi:hypothetical protein